jgi:hypothetical protein
MIYSGPFSKISAKLAWKPGSRNCYTRPRFAVVDRRAMGVAGAPQAPRVQDAAHRQQIVLCHGLVRSIG